MKESIGSVFHEQWAEMFHQLPRYVRIFGRVLTNVLHGHFTHRALPLTARPDERLDGDGAIAEVGFGEVIHVVAQLGVEQVVGDHRVEEWAVDSDTVFDQHHEVELDVLPHFPDRGVLKWRGEGSDRGVRFLFVGWHGHIPRFVGTKGERHADQPRVECVDALRFRVEGEGFSVIQPFGEGATLFVGIDQVIRVRRRGGVGCIGIVGRWRWGRRFVGEERKLLTRCGSIGWRRIELREEAAELEFGVELTQRIAVGFADGTRGGVESDRCVGDDRGEKLGEADLLGVRLDLRAECALELVGRLEQSLDAAELGEQLLRRLLTDARAAGDIVRGVAHQPEQVDHLTDVRQAILGEHLGRAHRLVIAAVARSELEDAVGDELPVVLVGRHHVDVELLLRGLCGDGADHVVGLVACDLKQRDVPRLDEPTDVGFGGVDVLGRLLALRLVFGEGLVAEGGAGGVESDGGVGGCESSEGIVERVDEAEDG